MNGNDSKPLDAPKSPSEELRAWLPLIATLISTAVTILTPLSAPWKFIVVSVVLWGFCYYLRFRRKNPTPGGSENTPYYIYPERVRLGALIGFISIPSIVLGIFASPLIITPHNTSTTGTTVFINNVQDNDSALLIETPYKVLVKGTASIKDGLHVYLVVYDGHFEYVQPDVVHTGNNGFEGYCYLGVEKDDPGSINKTYTIFAVITDEKYKANDHLDRKTVKASSNTIDLYRTR